MPELARSLHNLSNRLAENDDTEKALKAIQEAVDIRQQLAEDNPARYMPELANSLYAQGYIYLSVNDTAAAKEVLTSALECVRSIPEGTLPYRFRSLTHLIEECLAKACEENGEASA